MAGNCEMSIGDLAATTGLTVETIRYYERLGLFPPAARVAGGRRRFPGSTLERIALINGGKALGLTLAEIRELLSTVSGPLQCRAIESALRRHVERIDRQMIALRALRRRLSSYQRACAAANAASSHARCPTVDALVATNGCMCEPIRGRRRARR